MNVKDLCGKRILFFAPAFFRYEKIIADKMREMGAEVDMYDVRSVTSAFDRALLKVSPNIFRRKSMKYYEKIIAENAEKDYDFILIVKCDMTPIAILESFRRYYPNAKICLNLWDSVKNIPGVVGKFKYFDTLHSFDMNDCKQFKDLKFRPLFFCDQFRKSPSVNEHKYDISFMGTIHSDRYAVIKQVQKIADDKGYKCYWFMYLQSHFIFKFYKAIKHEFKGVPESAFSFSRMEAGEIANIVNDSVAILDIQHPKQTGLTIRTIEMVGMNKKLITTNQSIKDYDFYNPNNILIIDRNNVSIDEEFLKTQYEAIPMDIYEKYSLTSWILDVLS